VQCYSLTIEQLAFHSDRTAGKAKARMKATACCSLRNLVETKLNHRPWQPSQQPSSNPRDGWHGSPIQSHLLL
jgi:hypothetical protein